LSAGGGRAILNCCPGVAELAEYHTLQGLLNSSLDKTFYIFPTETPSAIHPDSVNLAVSDIAHQRTAAHA